MNRSTRYFLFGGAAGVAVACALIFGADASSGRFDLFAPRSSAAIAVTERPVVEEPLEVVARTGDRFWGLHVEGVIPCSAMVVRGGGHLVILTREDRPMDKCSYHVKGKKKVQLDERTFLLTVVSDDMIRVERIEGDGALVADDTAAEAAPELMAGP